MTYDPVGQLMGRQLPDGSVNTFAYDAGGNRTVIENSDGVTTLTYSERTKLSHVIHPTGKQVQYAFDAAGRRRQMTDADGGVFTYTHDSAGNLVRLENARGEVTTQTFDAANKVTLKQLPNGAVVSHTYNPAGWFTQLDNLKSGGEPVNRFTYTYDNVGNRTSQLELDGTLTTWTYDRTYQVLKEQRTEPSS